MLNLLQVIALDGLEVLDLAQNQIEVTTAVAAAVRARLAQGSGCAPAALHIHLPAAPVTRLQELGTASFVQAMQLQCLGLCCIAGVLADRAQGPFPGHCAAEDP